MSNPNNCSMCDHKKQHVTPSDGHCYMFRSAPTQPCTQHTSRVEAANAFHSMLNIAYSQQIRSKQ